MEYGWNDTDRDKQKYSEKSCPTPALSTTSPTSTGLVLKLGLRSERLAYDSLSNDLAFSGKSLELKYVFTSNVSLPSVDKAAHVV
jgi:hypothetical protein